MTNGITDPAAQWSDLLASLTGRRRDAVIAALRSSAEQGWPADREAVRLLVAYANGEIDAQDYAVGIVVSLGGHEGLIHGPRRSLEQQRARPPAEHQWAQGRVEHEWRTQHQAPAPPAAVEPRLTREEVVAAYVSGRISVEEFLRLTRGVSA